MWLPISTLSAFFWLMSLTASSLIWSAIPPLQDSAHDWAIVPVSVLLQEVARALFIILYLYEHSSTSRQQANWRLHSQ